MSAQLPAVATNLLPTASLSSKDARVGVEFVSNV